MRTGRRLLALWLAMPLLAAAGERTVQGNLEQLKARARTAKPQYATWANVRVARQEVEIADQYFRDGDREKAQAAVDEAVHYAELAGAALDKKSKHLKEAEILLRESERRLQEIRRDLDFDEQAPVKKAEERLEKVRSSVLATLFGPEK